MSWFISVARLKITEKTANKNKPVINIKPNVLARK